MHIASTQVRNFSAGLRAGSAPVRAGSVGASSRDPEVEPSADAETVHEGKPLGGSGEIEDELDLSPEAREATAGASTPGEQLTPEEQQVVTELKARDAEVRSHEQAHLAAAGPYARGGPTYSYQTGPDGKRYAIGGEVQIDTSPESDPRATIAKAQVIRAAAQAPAEPSSQDRAVAAAASKLETEARQQLREQEQTEHDADSETPETSPDLGLGQLIDAVG